MTGIAADGGADARTLAAYAAEADRYAACFATDPEADGAFRAFADALPEGPVLDLGCGPGTWAAGFAARGRAVVAWDASPAMVAATRARGVAAEVAGFDDLDAEAAFAGVWANFALLHAPRDALPRHLAAIARALCPRGVFHLGMKTGTGTRRDALGRRYTYVTEAEAEALVTGAGLHPVRRWTGASAGLDGVVAPWVILQARRDG